MGNSFLSSISLISALAVVGTSGLALVPIVAAGSALGLIRFGMQSFSDLWRALPARDMGRGIVYDARTLRPVPFAVIKLSGADGRIMERRVADRLGRFSFLISPVSVNERDLKVRLEVTAPDHLFPSLRRNDAADVLYGRAYRGELMTLGVGSTVAVGIPVDPKRPGGVPEPTRSPSTKIGIATAAMADAGLWVGLITVPSAFFLDPGPFSLGVLFVFLGVVSLRVFGIAEHPFGTVSDRSGNAVPYALVTIHDDTGSRIGFTVTDDRGRYVLPSDPGSFIVEARTPANIIPPRKTERSIATRRGWITQELIL